MHIICQTVVSSALQPPHPPPPLHIATIGLVRTISHGHIGHCLIMVICKQK